MKKYLCTDIKPCPDLTKILFRIVGVLTVLTMLSIWMVCVMFAKYTSKSSCSTGARVASFNVMGNGFSESLSFDLVMAPGDSKAEAITINNNSEVSIRYHIKIYNSTQNLPIEFNDNGTYHDLDEEYPFTGIIAPGQTAEPELIFAWRVTDDNGDDITDNHSPFYSGMLDNIRVTVTAEQID